MTRTLIALALAACALGVGLAVAQPSEQSQSRADARAEALTRRASRADAVHAVPPGPDPGDGFVTTLPHRNFREESLPSPGELATAAGCDAGMRVWRRDRDIEICATACVDDADCSAGERCRVVQTRATGPHALELAEEMQGDDDDDEDTIRLCDPFWDEPGPASALTP